MNDNSDDLIISISADQATLRRSIKRIEQDVGGMAATLKRQFDGVGKSLDTSLQTSLQTRINTMVGIGTKGAREWTGALADQGKELERLRAKYSPLFATITSYKTSVADIRRAHALGAISADEMTAAISRERQAALASTAAIKGRNQAMRAMVTTSGGGGGANSFNTSNLAAQGFDVMATAAFMPWYTVALQQGPQVAQVFNDIKSSGSAIGPAVAGAFMQLVNPISLVTIATIGATAAGIQYFSGVLSGSDETAEKLREQQQLINAVAERWGDAVPALRDYANELNRAKDAADLKSGVDIINEKTLESIKKQLSEARISIGALVQDLRSTEDDETIKALQTAYSAFAKAAEEGKLKTEDVKRVHDALASALNSQGIPSLSEFSKLFDTLSSSALSAAGSVEKVNEAAGRMLPESTWRSYNKQTGKFETNAQPWDDNIQYGDNFTGVITPEVGPVPASRPKIELEGLPGAEKETKKAETAAQRAANAYRDLKKSADDRIAQMRQEIDLVGRYGAEVDAARFALDLLQQAEDKGRSLSDAQRNELAQKVELYRQYSTELARAKLNQDLLDQARFNLMSPLDQKVVTTQRQYGLPEDLNSREAQAIRRSHQTQAQNDAIDQFASNLANGIISSGGDVGKAFGQTVLSALQESAQKQLTNLFSQILKSVFTNGGAGASGTAGGLGAIGARLVSGGVSLAGGKASSTGGAVDLAGSLLGANENTNRGQINSFLRAGGVNLDAAQQAWCAAFVNSSLAQMGIKGSGSSIANSFQGWGSIVDAGSVLKGDVLLKTRGLAAGQTGGHVGLATGASRMMDGNLQLQMLSGNSSNAVTNTWVNATELQVKRATEAANSLSSVASSANATTQGLGQFGNGLNQIGSSMGSGLGGIAGGFNWSSLFSPSWKPNTTFGAFLGLASGGPVSGPGTSTSDSIPTMLSDGEFVVKASASKKHRALLNAINSGTLGHMADGGLVSRAVMVPTAPQLRSGRPAGNDNGNPGVLQVSISGANGDDHVRALVKQGVGEGLQQYNKQQERGGFGSLQTRFQSQKG